MSRPYYEDDSVTLYHGDCREITEWLDADVLVFDPPYGRAWRQGAMKNADGHGRLNNDHDGIVGDADTVVRDDVLRLWGDRRAIAFGDTMLAPPSGTRQVLFYAKAPDAGIRGATAGHRRDVEAIYLIGPWPSSVGGRSSIIHTNARSAGPTSLANRYGHPHAKPLDVMAHLVGLDGGTVADPTAGGGSTLVIAKQLGRKAIGVESEEPYCEVIAKRLAQGVLDFGSAS